MHPYVHYNSQHMEAKELKVGLPTRGIHMTLLSGGVSVELHEEIQEGQSAQREVGMQSQAFTLAG